MRIFASLVGYVGEFFAKTTANACWLGFLDEEECPKSLLK